MKVNIERLSTDPYGIYGHQNLNISSIKNASVISSSKGRNSSIMTDQGQANSRRKMQNSKVEKEVSMLDNVKAVDKRVR